ncbi:hypothetical protein [Pseudonocardia sp. ICBG1034]|uniref:hypothetical protein n=1 Tax=Pseudonocardia sp. ICBG1034 TaxID=2844381 RepID=UPI001CCA3E02|nr:hypothetical protein [Pseudonocardia sp. ICBG1034]
MSDPTYRLLRELAGRVDDDLLATGRELVAVGEEGHALELLVAELVAGRAVLPHAVRSELVAEAAARRVQPDADACLPPAADVAAGPHRFDGDGPPGAAEAVAAALAGVPVPESGWTLAWRTTPAGAAPGPLPQPVLLARTGSHGAPEVLTYQAQSALARAGLVVSVEVGDDGPDPGYHRAAREAARPLPATPVSDAAAPSRDDAAAPSLQDVSAPLPGDAPRPTPHTSRSPLAEPGDGDGGGVADGDTSGPPAHRVPDDRPSDRVGLLSSATPPDPEDRLGRADPEPTTEGFAAAAPSPGAAGPDTGPDRAPDAATSGAGADPVPAAEASSTGTGHAPGEDATGSGSPASASDATASSPETGMSDDAAPGAWTGTADPATPTPETGTPDRATPARGTGTSDPTTSRPGTDTSGRAAPVPGTGTPDGARPGPAGPRDSAARRAAAPAEGEDTAQPAPRPSPPIRALREASAGDWFDSPPEGDGPDPTPPRGVGEVPRHRFVADPGTAGNGHLPDANGAYPTTAGRGPVAGPPERRPVGPAATPAGRPSAPSDEPPPPPVTPAPPGLPAPPAASSPPAAAGSPVASVPPVVPADPAATGPRAAPRDLGVPLRRRAGEGRAPAGGGPGPVAGRPPVGPPAAPGPDEASWLADWASGAWAGEIPPPETAARTDRSGVEETVPGTPHVVPAATAGVDDDRRAGPAHPAHRVTTGDDPARPTSGPAHPGPGPDRIHVGTSPAGAAANGAAPAPEDAPADPAHAGPAPDVRAGLDRPAGTGPVGTGTTGPRPPTDEADPVDEAPTPPPGVPILRAPTPPAPADGERRPRHLLLTDDEPDERDATERDGTGWDGTVEDPTEPADVVAPATERPARATEHPAPGPAEEPTTGPADEPAPRPRPRPRPAGGLADRLTPTEQDLLQRLHEELAARENGGEPTPRNGTARTDRG